MKRSIRLDDESIVVIAPYLSDEQIKVTYTREKSKLRVIMLGTEIAPSFDEEFEFKLGKDEDLEAILTDGVLYIKAISKVNKDE